ncbi:MAG: DUF4337 domain-containing protein [Isosphaeraceae bacterium]|nr:DUF4337 domain-containing protein [Isosphaeraceae bacterium]
MEEGPEPQEWVERSVEHGHEHAAEAGHARSEALVPALTAAILAVLAALASLLSGNAANQALVLQTRAADQWAYYQAKSTKEQVADTGRTVITSTAELLGAEPRRVQDQVERLRQEVERYHREKEEIGRQAEKLEAESERMFHKHHRFASGIASLQVSIVLASITILVRYRGLLWLSHLGGLVGVTFALLGWLG